MLKPSLPVAAVGLFLVLPPQAGAVTYYVNQSNGAASNGNACVDPDLPCLTIQAAVDKAKADSGNTVQVLPDPAGDTDTYNEAVDVSGGQPITLIGAGRGDGGTNIERSTGTPLFLVTASTARELKATKTGSGGAALSSNDSGSVFERVTSSAPAGTAFLGSGTVRDSLLGGQTGVSPVGTLRVVRTQIVATGTGVTNTTGYDMDMISCIVRSSGGTTGLAVSAGILDPRIRLRHVTVTGFATRVDVAASLLDEADLEAANSTFAGDSGTDLRLSGGGVAVDLNATNVSPARTVVQSGAPQPTKSNAVDVPPGLTADGHLASGSDLKDRGVGGGTLAGEPEDVLDIDLEPRQQGPAPDVGADELFAPGGGGPGGPAGGTPGAGTPGADTRAPLAVLAAARTQRVLRQQAVIVTARSDEAALLTASGAVALPGGTAATLRLKSVRRRVAANARVRLVLRVSRSGLRKLRRAFRRKRRLTARVTVRATDAAGNSRAASRRVRLRR